ncbi:unnamed protein product [Linum tenue]|uniref:RING-type domain-containing protein n=1 Tax=Linum tenue TaxID=586396 RepID=A0AAV0PHF9_9ROSI|nr:unnamed protein product [Linum tenue]CAI0472248.1 unnamed protein product [Linum tenue]
MGFPVGYTEIIMPKIFVRIFYFLGFLRGIFISVSTFLGLTDFIDPAADDIWQDYSPPSQSTMMTIQHHHRLQNPPPPTTAMIREILPVVKFEDLGGDRPESCAVCLYEFGRRDDVRWLESCRHVFHRDCLDCWMDQERSTCPLCRMSFASGELDRRSWATVGNVGKRRRLIC